ncbi:MAG: hypothetical protein IH964_11080 [Candidatus Dadabacteria bacterium]|nr:hypothetical protein [Candidatus Dadabacteria bacterium]
MKIECIKCKKLFEESKIVHLHLDRRSWTGADIVNAYYCEECYHKRIDEEKNQPKKESKGVLIRKLIFGK